MDRSALRLIMEKARQSGQKYLDLSSQQITKLPESIGQLTKLTYFDFRNNPLTILPESISYLADPKYLEDD
jgi:Leucine-rich repeat (LRR) protein